MGKRAGVDGRGGMGRRAGSTPAFPTWPTAEADWARAVSRLLRVWELVRNCFIAIMDHK